LIQSALFLALKAGARVRILVGDYLYITDPEALRRLHGAGYSFAIYHAH